MHARRRLCMAPPAAGAGLVDGLGCCQASSGHFKCGVCAGHALQDSFADVGATEEVVRALGAMGIQRPSYIQAAAYRALRGSDSHVVLADHAGTPLSFPSAAPAHSLQ